ncbi:HGGxSTG domain-containing protein [Shewanella mangrovi]|uniref:HGGxSTG domain-containing protein n=1 Tax=Shewanella mangrovi TaxID=1515746 RepID=UPI0005620EAD|nr:HGGxSTG domain-containing protein [Shewanella mangrovi]
MARFNLDKLPRCGAKTRSGGTCQRYGNKVNGRCKLHGGRSTGAKTKEGKLAVRVNALVNVFVWQFEKNYDLPISQSDWANAITAYLKIVELSNSTSQQNSDEITELVGLYRVELEATKYCIAEYDGLDALLLIQSALDHYYKDTAATHLKFHIHAPVYPAPYFDNLNGSQAEFRYMMQSMANTGDKLYNCTTRHYLSPMQRMLRQYLKAHKKSSVNN